MAEIVESSVVLEKNVDCSHESINPLLIVLLLVLILLFCCLCLLLLVFVWKLVLKRKRKGEERRLSEKELNVYGAASSSDTLPAIPFINFPLYVKRMHENGDYPFSKEFESIEPKHYPTRHASLKNQDKDRFSSFPTYDHSRVVLEKCPSGSDYINANYIDGFAEDTGQFIATQGPLQNTVGDFWWMVWEHRIPYIIMLTNLKEKEMIQSCCYWPRAENESLQYMDCLKVTLESEAVQMHQTIRTFTLEYEMSSEVKSVTQYHYTSWPDHGVPKSTESLLQLIEHIRAIFKPHHGPILVHCSTGAGRTGAFIALYVMLTRLTKTNTVDIYNYVQNMRRQRMSMVSNETEYIFVHDALVDALRLGMIQGYISGLDTQTRHSITN